MKSLAELGSLERGLRAGEFASLCRIMAASAGGHGEALRLAERSRAPARVVSALKAAVGAGGPASPAWGSETVDYRIMAGGFLDALASESVFFRLLANGAIRAPLRSRVVATTTAATGTVVGPGKPVPVSALALAATDLVPLKAAALCVVSKEVLTDAPAAAETMISSALRAGVTAAVDSSVLTTLTAAGLTTHAATANVLSDLAKLFVAVELTGAERLLFVASPDVARRLRTVAGSGGATLFADPANPLGVPLIATTRLAAGTLLLVDASGVAGNAETPTIRTSEEAAVQMDTAPTQDAMAGTGSTMVSMYQSNSVALQVSLEFAAVRLRNAAVARLTSIAW